MNLRPVLSMPPGVRQGGGFAKRNAASSKLSRKIGWLNNTGSLQQEIRFSDVKDLLQKVGDDDAMQILKNLEKKAKEIQNPTGYISNSAKNCLDGGRRQRSRTQRGRQGPVPEPEEPPKDRWRDAEAEEPQDISHDGDAPMADQEPDDWNEDVNLEEDADGKEDTEPADVQQLEDQMRMLNSNAGLNQDLDIDQLLEPLTSMGTSKALEILSHLEEKASEVKNPTNYILAAVSKRGKGKGKGKGKGGQDRRGKGVIKTHLKEKRTFDPAMVEKVKKRISWLNDKANLNDQLSYDKVGELLLESGPIAEVMKILKTLEENASEVRNPNGYITSAARRLREEGVAPEPKTGPKKQDYRNEPLDKQLRAHIVWLNKEVPLNASLDYDKVSQSLLSIETADAGEILRRLEESAKEVRDPNGYVIKAAQRVIEGDHGKGGCKGDRWEVPEPPPPTSSSSVRRPPPRPPPASTEDDKIAKRVHWLNGHANLSSPLDYDRLASSFRNLGYYQSLEVLNNLEEHASTVRDPTAYVLAGIKKITHDGGAARPSTSQALPAPSKGGGRGKGGEDKLRRQIEWLNDRVCTTGILQLDKVLPVLMSLSTQQAFDVLKNFEENANSVRDPTAYAIGTARKAERGETIGTGRKASVTVSEAPRLRAPRAKGEGRPPEPIGSFGKSGKPSRAPPQHNSESRIRRQVQWLNRNAELQSDLDEERVVSQLTRVSDREAMDILKRLEDSASTVRDPTAYVISAYRRAVDGKGKGRSGK